MAYVAPTWKDGGPPALNAAALQAISDAIVGAESKNASQDSLIATLQTAVGGKGQIEVGSYVGTGTYGASNPNSITCSFVPKLVIVDSVTDWVVDGRIKSYGAFPWIYGVGVGKTSDAGNYQNDFLVELSWNGNSVSWYSTRGVPYQLNEQGKQYKWIAIG